MSTQEIKERIEMIKSETNIVRSEMNNVMVEIESKKQRIAGNKEKIRINKQLPYLIGTVMEVLNLKETSQYGSSVDIESARVQGVVVKTSTRFNAYLPMVGLVKAEDLEPGDLVALHRETNIIFEKLGADYDVRVKGMLLTEKPVETYEDIGGLDKQIEELNEAVILPFLAADRFVKMGIRAPKGVLMYGPPGTGKTLMARACAARTEAAFIKLSASQLVQMYIGDGARMIRDCFAMARAKKKAIIFIDEIDAIGTKRFDSEKTGDREVQRTMLELLNQMDGFKSNDTVKVIAATNRIDILDPALLRSGRFDRKIEFPLPDAEGRARIMQIHARKMKTSDYVNFQQLGKLSVDMNGAQCMAVCIEAGMIAIKEHADLVEHRHFVKAIDVVKNTKSRGTTYHV